MYAQNNTYHTGSDRLSQSIDCFSYSLHCFMCVVSGKRKIFLLYIIHSKFIMLVQQEYDWLLRIDPPPPPPPPKTHRYSFKLKCLYLAGNDRLGPLEYHNFYLPGGGSSCMNMLDLIDDESNTDLTTAKTGPVYNSTFNPNPLQSEEDTMLLRQQVHINFYIIYWKYSSTIYVLYHVFLLIGSCN